MPTRPGECGFCGCDHQASAPCPKTPVCTGPGGENRYKLLEEECRKFVGEMLTKYKVAPDDVEVSVRHIVDGMYPEDDEDVDYCDGCGEDYYCCTCDKCDECGLDIGLCDCWEDEDD